MSDKPNPLDEIKRLEDELDSVVGDCERSHAERLSVLGENARLTERNRALESELEALRELRSIPEPSGRCSVCRRSYVYHIERWGNSYGSASMPLEWHPFKGGT